MANRFSINNPELPFVYNIDTPVGTLPSNMAGNDTDDVQLVQVLLFDLINSGLYIRGNDFARPLINGKIDVVTAFWVYETERTFSGKFDGYFSPIHQHSGLYGPNSPWMLAILNYNYFKRLPQNFANLPNDPRLSGSLQQSIAEDDS